MVIISLFASSNTANHPLVRILGILLMCAPALLVIFYILWDRRYRSIWELSHSKNWPRVEGKFDDGEVVTMRKGRSNTVAGYSVYLSYEYGVEQKSEAQYLGLFASREFDEKEQAEEYRALLANRSVPVRVSPRDANKSYVLAIDLPADLIR